LDMRLTAGLFARSVGQADDSGWQEFRVAFNEYKDLLRKHEPFVYVDIYEPARQIEKLGREIAHQTQCIARLAAEGERRKLGPTKDEVIADRLVQAKHEREAAAEQIEPLFDQVKQAMRKRIMLRS